MNFDHFFSEFSFHPVMRLPNELEVYDFSKSYDKNRLRSSEYGVGIFNEKRVGMYTTELFTADPANVRDIHMGVDLAAPALTPIHAVFDGVIFCAAINSAAGDYGGTLITEHRLKSLSVWILHGHLSHSSAKSHQAGDPVQKGQVIGYLGTETENGGWNPHLHFQVSLEKPVVCDMPGAVSDLKLADSLRIYLDPRLILGPIY